MRVPMWMAGLMLCAGMADSTLCAGPARAQAPVLVTPGNAAPGLAAPVLGKPALGEPALDGAARNYPPLIPGANIRPATGTPPAACPIRGARVDTKGGPNFEYLGLSGSDPDLCRVRVGGQEVDAWFGIWLTDWPGAAQAHPALKQVMAGSTGTVAGFDVRMAPGYAFHDLIRNEGIESIRLLGATYQAMKLSHYREGFDGNTYRSVSTVWKDMATGLLIYGTYQHISGTPEIDDPLIPTAIAPAAQ